MPIYPSSFLRSTLSIIITAIIIFIPCERLHVLEAAFAWCEKLPSRRMITGVNWSPGIINPFRHLGEFGVSLDSVLQQQYAGADEPIIFLLHCVYPRVEYTDRGKSAVVVRSAI